MFALFISVGIVVDGVIIVVEFADRKMAEGVALREAYASAARRMFWPVACSIPFPASSTHATIARCLESSGIWV